MELAAEDALDYADPLDGADALAPMTAGAGSGVGRAQKAAAASHHDLMTEAELAQLGADVVEHWARDKAANKDWRTAAENALSAAAQDGMEPKAWPWPEASNVRYPLLTVAGLQFAARAYPAIVKGDQAVQVKTFGRDPLNRKSDRAERVRDYLNYLLFYVLDGWEEDTDSLLHILPAAGQHFRKVWWDDLTARPCIESVSALRLTLDPDAVSLAASPRITHDYDRYGYQVRELQASGVWRDVKLLEEAEDEQSPRLILEQHLLRDFDDDGVDEPYVVTVDHSTAQVLRIDPAWHDEGVRTADDGRVIGIDRNIPFVSYSFIPDPKGRFYSIGFGHLLTPLMEVINTTINQMMDAGTAQVAGGGFIGSEIRLQGAGQGGVLRFRPGEYKTVNAVGAEIRNAIVERTFPNPSPVLFQLLGQLMEAAKDIASVNDAITGDAARTAPVGTTLALIEQGQQVWSAIYKRVYRALRDEFKLLYQLVSRYGDAADYAEFMDLSPPPEMMGQNGGPPMAGPDGQPTPEMAPQQAQPPQQATDPAALFEADFAQAGLDIRPISDPGAATKMQQMAKDQVALQFVGKPASDGRPIYIDDRAVIRHMLENAGIEQAAIWIPDQPPQPQAPDPRAEAQAAEIGARAQKATAGAHLDLARAAEIAARNSGPAAAAETEHTHALAMKAMTEAAVKASEMLPSVESVQ